MTCECKPCPECGFKHYCNLNIDHRGPIRTGDCPPAPAATVKPT